MFIEDWDFTSKHMITLYNLSFQQIVQSVIIFFKIILLHLDCNIN